MIHKEKDTIRIDRYNKYQKLYDGDHAIAFNEKLHNLNKENLIYIVQNLCAVISNISADYLVGSGVMVVAEDESQQDIIDTLNSDINSDALIYEAALTSAYMGDVIFLIHQSDDEDSIEYSVVSPEKYYPIYDGAHSNSVVGFELHHNFEENDVDYVLIETYTIGKIERSLFAKDKETGDLTDVPLGRIFPDMEEEQNTNIDFLPVVHIKNFSTAGSRWGISDLKNIESLQHALNNRLSQIDTILDKHADPKMIVPQGTLNQNGEIDRGDMELFEVPSGEDGMVKPEYITWNANLKEAFEDVDMLIKQLARVAEIPLTLLGMDNGGAIESGVAIQLKYASLLKKIERKKAYFRRGVEDLYEKVLKASGVSDPSVNVDFGNSLPENRVEELTITDQRIANGTLSKIDAIKRLDKVDEEEATGRLAEIEKDRPRLIENTPPRVTLPSEE